jgi:hypothetical protein
MTLSNLTRALVALSMAAALPCAAQTVANGPYYAMPAWDQKLQCDTVSTCPRFVVLANWNSEAVLDRETGLVWERAPTALLGSFSTSTQNCVRKSVGGKRGWRLPKVEELQSLLDGETFSLALPSGHPFVGILSSPAGYWTASLVPSLSPPRAWKINLGFGEVIRNTDEAHLSWCVRGPGGATF